MRDTYGIERSTELRISVTENPPPACRGVQMMRSVQAVVSVGGADLAAKMFEIPSPSRSADIPANASNPWTRHGPNLLHPAPVVTARQLASRAVRCETNLSRTHVGETNCGASE